MRKTLALLALTAAVGGCTRAFHVPPGAERETMVGAILGEEHRIMADIMKYGFPDTGMLRYREGYVVSYDARNKVPHWVAERLNAKRLQPAFDRPRGKFRVDRTLAEEHRATSLDYADSGYVRGRMAAAANNLDDKVAFEQTYYLSNVCPQQGEYFRQTFWVRFEQTVRDWARQSDDLYVVTGPLFLPQQDEEGKMWVRYEVIGENNVGVPTHFFKVMLRVTEGKQAKYEMQAFIVPHRMMEPGTSLDQFLVNVDKVERLAGVDFYPDLSEPSQSRLEAKVPETSWK